MCMSSAPAAPETPEPPAPAAPPAPTITPQIKSNRKTNAGELRDRAKGKSRFRVDTKNSKYSRPKLSFGGLNIPM